MRKFLVLILLGCFSFAVLPAAPAHGAITLVKKKHHHHHHHRHHHKVL